MIAKNLADWRKLVLAVDENTCRLCGEPASIADHIVPRALDIDLILDVNNGRALCPSCHAKYGTKVYRIDSSVDLSNSASGDNKESSPRQRPDVNWDRELEIQSLCICGEIRDAAKLENKSLSEFIKNRILTIQYFGNGITHELSSATKNP